MKSIKEKANEYAKDYLFSISPTREPNEHFVAGANYVLEQVEMLLNSQRFVDNPSQELFELIAQLKK